MIKRLAREPSLVLGAAAFLLAGALATELARPFRGGPVAFDAAAAVLYFDRLVSGRELESVLTTMPKPLMTVVYGGLHALVPDWRMLSWVAILAFALGVAVATVLAWRIGGAAAAAFMAVGLAAAPVLLLDVGLALGWGLALLALAAAGLALAQTRPRWGLAGLALAMGALVRLELAVVIAGATGALAVVALAAWASGRPVPRDPMRLLVATVALPVMLLHDWLLTGNPLHWAGIADRYTRRAPIVPSFTEVWGSMIDRYAAVIVLCLLAAVAVIWLVRSGRAWLAIGLLLLGPGVALLFLVIAARGTFVDLRYFTAVDVALIAAAAFGLGALRHLPRRLVALIERVPRPARRGLALGTGAVLAIAFSGALGAFDASLRQQVRNQLRLAIDTEAVLPELQAVVDRHPQSREFAADSLDGTPLLFVPVKMRPHLIVDLALPMPEVASTDGSQIDLAAGYPSAGQTVYHHLRGERRLGGFEVLRTTAPREIDGVRLVPLATDEGRGYWVVSIEEP